MYSLNRDSAEVMSRATRCPSHLPEFSFSPRVLQERQMLTQDRLKELLNYDPLTGIFSWRVNGGRKRKDQIAGSKDVHGYWQIGLDNRLHKAHRLAWLYVYGWLPAEPLDHIDFNGCNNAIANLRLLEPHQHIEHRRRNKNNTSGFRGVHLCKSTGRWVAQIKTKYKWIWLGRFDTPEAAHQAYKNAAKIHHTHNPAAA